MKLAFLAAAGLAASAAALAQTQQTPPATPPTPPPACTGPEHRQFDFWVGDWDLYRTGQNVVVAHSTIERLFAGCVIRETWNPLQAPGGSSLNHYDREQRRWHQTWMDGANSRVVFEGGLVGGKMVLTGFWKGANGPGQDGWVRMTYTPNPDGSVRQSGELSTDHAVTWSPFFDFTYRKRASSAGN
jgi:hypothetical protein